MALVDNNGMRIIGIGVFGRAMMKDPKYVDRVNFKEVFALHQDESIVGVFIPHSLWVQVQHFVSRTIEREN